MYQTQASETIGTWKTFDVEAAFLNAELHQPVFIEWPLGMEEVRFISEEGGGKDYILHSAN